MPWPTRLLREYPECLVRRGYQGCRARKVFKAHPGHRDRKELLVSKVPKVRKESKAPPRLISNNPIRLWADRTKLLLATQASAR
jgi:hypothetical protein